jgi:hypothetical protein
VEGSGRDLTSAVSKQWNTLSYDIWCAGPDSNQAPLKQKSEALSLPSTYLVNLLPL